MRNHEYDNLFKYIREFHILLVSILVCPHYISFLSCFRVNHNDENILHPLTQRIQLVIVLAIFLVVETLRPLPILVDILLMWYRPNHLAEYHNPKILIELILFLKYLYEPPFQEVFR